VLFPVARTVRSMLAALLFTGAAVAQAAVTYSYTSANYSVFFDDNPSLAYNTSQRLTFSFTRPTALAAGATTDLCHEFLGWTAHDGRYSFGSFLAAGAETCVNNGILQLSLTNHALGGITSWAIDLVDLAAANFGQTYSRSGQLSAPIGDPVQVFDYIYGLGPVGVGGIGKAGTTLAGSWTVDGLDPGPNNTPEPGSWALVALGLATLALRKRQQV
jgi:hypothetical protein